MGPKLPHIPLWVGAAYRLIDAQGTMIPVRLLAASARAIPRKHTLQRLEDDALIELVESSVGTFFVHGAPVSLELA